ncbi:DNA-binding protein [Desulfonema ishimotonii]|uniref:DNA-binding protein n=1 Tax=Desulfonema ishimotonii TaxID=45657 RepID=A0A401G129_9BACT|nr:DNA-binding protein [Desulfonema ishimotonii]
MSKELTVQEIRSGIINLPERPPVIYETEIRSLNEAAKRNIKRLPDDFRFRQGNFVK